MIENVLDDSTVSEFGDDILLFWLQRQTEMERDRVGDPPAPRWFSPFAETQDSGQGAF